MKFLFDQNLSFKLCGQLTDLFPNSGHARLLGLAEADDRALWQFAGANGYALVTLDADFAELAALRGSPPKVIWLRCGNQATATVARLLREHRETIAAFERDPAACLEIYPLLS
jgi:predicted nuclease of predicted toxin-antitoxin system